MVAIKSTGNFLLKRRALEHIAGQYFLRAVDAPGAPAGEMRILRCDGRPVDAVAAQLDLNVTNWWVLANRSLAAPRLLVDNGNPFINRIGQCVVLTGGRERQIDSPGARRRCVKSRPRSALQRRRAGTALRARWQATAGLDQVLAFPIHKAMGSSRRTDRRLGRVRARPIS